MTDFFADPSVGGDGTHTTDDDNPSTGLANGGFWTRLVPMFKNVVSIANFVRTKADDVAQKSQIASNAAETAVTASNVAVQRATLQDNSPVVQSASDATKFVRIDASTKVPTGTTVVLTSPATPGTIATEAFVANSLAASGVSTAQLANQHATALSF